MGINCKVCKQGKMVFYDGGTEHEPIWVCNNCGTETEKVD